MHVPDTTRWTGQLVGNYELILGRIRGGLLCIIHRQRGIL